MRNVKIARMRAKIVSHLSAWFQKNARTLPWRTNPDPYWVWLSEIMLQQTQVTTVLPYFKKFIERFPDVQFLANASLDDVYQLWAGLGYYSRARNLHKGAQAISARLRAGLGFPANREEWLKIPGVGEYTAGAICSIALNQPEPIVDGNVVRVLARVNAISKIDAKKTQIWDEARALVKTKKVVPGEFNQALMELGALVCKPKNPKCSECAIERYCLGKKNPEKFPAPKAKVVWKYLKEEKWVLVRHSKKQIEVYLEQNQKKGWRQGLWDFPDAKEGSSLKIKSRTRLKDEFEVRYTVTNHKIARKHTMLELLGAHAKAPSQSKGSWFLVDELPGVPAPVKKAMVKVTRALDRSS